MSQENTNNTRHDFTAMLNIGMDGMFDSMSSLRLSSSEARMLATISPQLTQIRTQFDQALREHIADTPFLSYGLSDSLQQRIHERQRSYFALLLESKPSSSFLADRSKIEYAHQQMGLNRDWYFSAYRKYLGAVWGELQDIKADHQLSFSGMMLMVFKLCMFDLGLALEIYSEVEKKRFFESYIADMQVPPPMLAETRQAGLVDYSKRKKLETLLQSSIDDSPQMTGHLSICYLGLDQYEQVAESYGFEASRLVLQTIEIRLRAELHDDDVITHLGGGEYLLILPGHSDSGEVLALCQRVMNTFTQAISLIGQKLNMSCCIGIAMYPEDGPLAEDISRCAEVAFRRARECGPGSLRFYSVVLNSPVDEQKGLASDLRIAIQDNQLQLFYQPKADLRHGKLAGCEALLRWQHPTRGEISPAKFVPIAEQSDLIVLLGYWVIRRACADIQRLLEQQLTPPVVAINVSPRQLKEAGFPENMLAIMNEYGVTAEHLSLEVTESVLIDCDEGFDALFFRLKSLGFSLSLDDFGTGYSALGYLKRFSFDYVKIDQSFVRELPGHLSDASISKAIISMAHSMGMEVIAEGVETEAQCKFFSDNLCEQVQGYFYARPMPFEQLLDFVRQDVRLNPHVLQATRPERTLLLVDDEPNILSALKRLLRKDGYRILTGNSASEGLQILASENVDVIMSDQRMPEMSGVEFLRQAKALYPDTVRIILSGYSELQYITDAINEGAIYKFLTKPWDDEQIRKNISDAFQFKEILNENRRLNLEIQSSNRELVRTNRQLSDILKQKQNQIQRDEVSIGVIRDILHQIPFPLIGIDDEDRIAFCNLQAEELLPGAAVNLDNELHWAFPELAERLNSTDQQGLISVKIGGRTYHVDCRAMGKHSASNGRIIIFLPVAETSETASHESA
ncbi:EAL domain-containing protein [Undibacterium sp. CY7W]|uniref:Diguanylate cyclase DosC n=1 Tax=Undibacterium rugosum TaxID=2762291 RepID=A0A923I1I7_9BURK|nr:EAL domain-containing protein [Undibacterium rugosum]MBC3935956.1 EAL domain-containing protein [Undibacterium rugosum]